MKNLSFPDYKIFLSNFKVVLGVFKTLLPKQVLGRTCQTSISSYSHIFGCHYFHDISKFNTVKFEEKKHPNFLHISNE